MPNPIDAAWAAGLFEGEGTFHALHGRYPRASMSSTDHDVMMRFVAIVGVGTLAGPIVDSRFPDRKPLWRWNTTNAQDFVRLAALLEPQLGSRRRERLAELRVTTRLADPAYVAGNRTPSHRHVLLHARQGIADPDCPLCQLPPISGRPGARQAE